MTHRPGTRALAITALLAFAAVVAACTAPSKIDTLAMSFSERPLVGKVVWNDLITEDLAAARRFYGGMFGWEFEETVGPRGRAYLLARSGQVYVAGMVPVDANAEDVRLSRWLPYVSVLDVDAALDEAAPRGGRVVVAARDVPLGRVAVLQDPEGAVIGIARSNIGDPDEVTSAPGFGRLAWTELLSDDPNTAAAFYQAVVGYAVQRVERRGGEYTILSSEGVDRAGILANPTEEWSPAWLTSFGVRDAGAAAAKAESLGGTVLLAESPEVRDGTMAIVADPSGAVLVLQELED